MNNNAIIIIKKGEKYLQVYDKNWETFLFMYCKVENENSVKDFFSKKGIFPTKIEFVKNVEQTKYSLSSKTIKTYIHSYYKVDVNLQELETCFTKDDIKYTYLTKTEMLSNKELMSVNKDVIEEVINII